MSEERVRHPPDLSSTRASRGSAHPGGVSGVLFERDLEASFASSRSWTDAASGAGEVRQYSDARRFFPHHRWALSDHAALHRTGRRCRVAAASTQAHSAEPAPSAHCRAHRRAPAPTENVVQTLRRSALKIKGLRIPEPANCESSVNLSAGDNWRAEIDSDLKALFRSLWPCRRRDRLLPASYA